MPGELTLCFLNAEHRLIYNLAASTWCAQGTMGNSGGPGGKGGGRRQSVGHFYVFMYECMCVIYMSKYPEKYVAA